MHYNTVFEICQTGMSCKSEKILNSGNLEKDNTQLAWLQCYKSLLLVVV